MDKSAIKGADQLFEVPAAANSLQVVDSVLIPPTCSVGEVLSSKLDTYMVQVLTGYVIKW